MALASGIDTSIKLFLMTAIYTEKQNGRRFHAREHRLGFGDARELKIFGEHSPSLDQTNASPFLVQRNLINLGTSSRDHMTIKFGA